MQEIRQAYTPVSSRYVFDKNKINWNELAEYGLSKETFGQSKVFDALLKGEKSPGPYPLTVAAKDGNGFLHGYERISLQRNSDGRIGLQIHFPMIYEEVLNTPFSGHKFSRKEKTDLISMRNLGHIIDLKDDTGKITPGYVSLDMQTNELMTLEASRLKIPESLNLDKEQKNVLLSGKPLWVESMQSPSGKTFPAMLQVNAEKKGIEFMFENDPRLEHVFNTEMQYTREVHGVSLTTEQLCKMLNGCSVSFSKLKDEQGKTFKGSLRMNFRTGKVDAIPDEAKREKQDLSENNIHNIQQKRGRKM